MAEAIEVKNLKKSFKKNDVLRGVSFNVPSGTVFALLGPNGAGKTTIINILTTLLSADSGTATVAGFDTVKGAESVRWQISLTGQFAAIDDMLTGKENLLLIAELRHDKAPDQTAERLLKQFDLIEAADRRALSYSGGMRRRLDIAMSLIGHPKIIFFDEPTTGLDPSSRNSMWATIKELAAKGTTVFLTTQYLEEADQLADQIAIINHGQIVAKGAPASLKKLLPGSQIEFKFTDARSLETAFKVLSSYATAKNSEELSLTVTTAGSLAELTRLFHSIEDAHLEITEFSQHVPTLDDAFLKIINQEKEN